MTQISDYLEFLDKQEGRRALILLTQHAEVIPAKEAETATSEMAHAKRLERWKVTT